MNRYKKFKYLHERKSVVKLVFQVFFFIKSGKKSKYSNSAILNILVLHISFGELLMQLAYRFAGTGKQKQSSSTLSMTITRGLNPTFYCNDSGGLRTFITFRHLIVFRRTSRIQFRIDLTPPLLEFTFTFTLDFREVGWDSVREYRGETTPFFIVRIQANVHILHVY